MKLKIKYTASLFVVLIVSALIQVSAQIPVRTGPASLEEINRARKGLDTSMNSLLAHKKYIYAMGISNPLVVEQYRIWMKQYPKNITIPLSIGTVFYGAEMPQAKEFLLKVVDMEPKNAQVLLMLSADASTRGQAALSIEYKRKAMLADTSNADYASNYLMSFESGDLNEYKNKVYDFIKRFPESAHGAAALYWLGERTTNITDKIRYFEDLRKLYPPRKFRWSSSGMTRLADAYLQTEPEKALPLISEMGDGEDWKSRNQLVKELIEINKLEKDKNYKEATFKIDQVELPGFNYLTEFIVLKKSSLQEKSGDVKIAYDSLAVKFAKLPNDQYYNALESYGKEIGKNKEQIVKDIDSIRNRTAVAAYPFDLGLYTSKGNLNLKELKGKVVLLTFWFPACSPCREEFPHFEAVLDKFNRQDVVYIGISVTPLQDGYVIPIMKNAKYSFIPLRGTPEFAKDNYGVSSEPENFLIDKEGKIIFRKFRIDDTNHRTLELMITSLLQKGN